MPRGRKENLGDFRDLTAEEQRKIASAGGKKSVESRRKKKTLRDTLSFFIKKLSPVVRIFLKLRSLGKLLSILKKF